MIARLIIATCITSLTVVVPISSSAQVADRVLRIPANTCDYSKGSLIAWASRTEGYSAIAVPTATQRVDIPCSNPGNKVAATDAWGYDTQAGAVEAAKAQCLTNLPQGFTSCTVVATSFDRLK